MRVTRFTETQILAILRQAEGGVPVPELAREHGMSNASFYKWRAKYGGMDASMISQMKALEDENKPRTIRVDNGHEYVSSKLSEWAENKELQSVKPHQESSSKTLMSNAITVMSAMSTRSLYH